MFWPLRIPLCFVANPVSPPQDYLCVWGYRGRIGNNILAFVASNFSNMYG